MRGGEDMTEKRKAEDTVCPKIYAALLQRFAVNLADKIGDFKLVIPEDDLNKLAACLGKECQMFNVNFRGCGLRNK